MSKLVVIYTLNIYNLQETSKKLDIYILYIYIYICIYVCICVLSVLLLKNALPVIAIIALWQLVHLGTPMYGYMFLTFRIQTKLKLTLKQQG